MDEQQRAAVAGALGRIPSGLFVVSAREGETEGAFLASWVMQAGFEPPMLTVGLGADRAVRALIEPEGAAFAVSVVATSDRNQLGPYYKGVEPGANALDELEIERTPAGLAVIRGCLAWLECRTRGSMVGGDHLVILGEVGAARAGRSDEPAVHTRSNGLSY